ncbi:unnamed protein product, partial [Oikopleura dioica]
FDGVNGDLSSEQSVGSPARSRTNASGDIAKGDKITKNKRRAGGTSTLTSVTSMAPNTRIYGKVN